MQHPHQFANMAAATVRGLLLACVLTPLIAGAVPPMVVKGWNYAMALRADGKVFVWGDDTLGQLGLGRAAMATTPQVVPGLNIGPNASVARLAAGDTHTLALKSDGTVWAWGGNYAGQLGDGSTIGRPAPVHSSGLANVVALAAAGPRSVAVKSDGSV